MNHGRKLRGRTLATAALAAAMFAGVHYAASVEAQVAGVELAAAQVEPPAIALTVTGMQCEGCKRRLKAGLSELEGVSRVEVDLEKGWVAVWATDPAEVENVELEKATTDRGFNLEEVYRGEEAAEKLAAVFPDIGG